MNQQQQPQDFERFEHQVEDMYNVLLNISSELLTIKSMMKVNRKLATEQHQHETINEGNNCKYVLCNYTKYKRKYISLRSLACLQCKMPMFQRIGMREGGALPLALFLTEEIQYHDGLRSRELGQASILLCVPNS